VSGVFFVTYLLFHAPLHAKQQNISGAFLAIADYRYSTVMQRRIAAAMRAAR
jgi:hypothetical protein